MDLKIYILAKLLLFACVNARGIQIEEGHDIAIKDTFVQSDTATQLDVSTIKDGVRFADDRTAQSEDDSALETNERQSRSFLFPRYPTYLGPEPFLRWPSFSRQAPQVPVAPYVQGRAVPVRVTQFAVPFQVVVDPLLNVTVTNTALPVQVLNDSLNVQVSNTLLPVGIVNTSLPVDITNTELQVGVSNVPLPVGVVNGTLGVRLADLPLPVGIINTTLPVTVDASVPLDATILNVPLPVGIVNTTLAVDVVNLPLAVNVANAPLPVGVVNQTLSVTLADKPVPVGIVNESLPVNVTNLVLNTTVLNVPLPVGVVNTTLGVNVMNQSLPVVLLNQTIEVGSPMLLDGLTAVLNDMTADFNSEATRIVCPTDSQFGTATTAPCRRLGSMCFCFFVSLKKNYADATSFCLIAGFDGLVTFETAAKQAAVNDLAKLLGLVGNRYYTSATDSAVEGTFVWKPSNTPVSGNLWTPGEPNSSTGDEDCVVTDVGGTGALRDASCSDILSFICEAGNIQNSIGK